MKLDADAALVERAARGDEAAFRTLFERYGPRVLGLATRITGGAADGEDVLQETFVKVHRRLPSFRFESTFSLWLYKIALHEALNWKSRRAPLPPLEREPEAPAPDEAAGEAMLAKLSPPLRAVMLLRYVHDFSYDEIADLLDLPVGTVRSRLHEAHAALR